MAQYLNVIKNLDFCIQSVRTSNALHNLERNSDHPLSHGTFTKKNPVFRCPLLGSLLYSGDLNTDHLNTGNIWLPNFLKFKFQMVQYSMGYVPCTVMTILILDQYIKKHDGFHLSGIKMVGLSSIQMAFENQTIWHPTYFRPFEYQTSSIFRSPLYNVWWKRYQFSMLMKLLSSFQSSFCFLQFLMNSELNNCTATVVLSQGYSCFGILKISTSQIV